MILCTRHAAAWYSTKHVRQARHYLNILLWRQESPKSVLCSHLSDPIMAALLSLPTELIVCIYANCPTLQSAASLSATNKRLYSTWLDDENHIVEAILSPQIPAYEAAVELAILEEIWIKSNTQLSSTMDKPPIRLYLKRLLQTVDCASNTATLWNAERVRTWREARAPAPAHASYYLLRNIILS